MGKINCTNPNHKDSTPSMEVYEDGGFCFSCGWVDKEVDDKETRKKDKENIEEKIQYIKTLRTKLIRGFSLPYDERGYYILWPNERFYKLRTNNQSCRYIGPRGYKPPLFILEGKTKDLAIIEGELNALSLAKSFNGTIVSPGSATELSAHYSKYLNLISDNAIVYLIVDKDPAGVAAGMDLRQKLMKKGKRVRLIACEKDLNQILQDEGQEGIKKFTKEYLEV